MIWEGYDFSRADNEDGFERARLQPRRQEKTKIKDKGA
jgi:hypothetical protein